MRLARLSVLAAAVTAVCPAQAEELRIQANASTLGEFNDNPNLTARNRDSVIGLVAGAGVDLRWGAEAWQWNLAPRVVARRYSGKTDLDSRDVFVDAGHSRVGERFEFGLVAAYAREATATSQFAATGVTEQNLEREVVSAGVSGTYRVSERVDASAQLSREDVRFSGEPGSGVRDYDYWKVRGSLGHALGERSRVNLIAGLSRVDGALARSREISLGIGLDHAWSERWRTNLAIGPSWSDIDGRDRSLSTSYRASLSGAWERTALQLGVERLLSPQAAQGRLQTRDALFGSLLHRLSTSLDLSAFVNGEVYSDVGRLGELVDDTSGTLSGGAALSWRPVEAWSWRLAYTHTLRDADGSPTSNVLSAGVAWNGRPRSSSH